MRATRVLTLAGAAIVFTIVVYASWYAYNRAAVERGVQACAEMLSKPQMMRAPDGTMVPVYSLDPCAGTVVPPRLADLLRGRMAFEGVPDRMIVNPYSFADVLLGRYTLGVAPVPACDQSATTTDCSKLVPMRDARPI